MHIDPYFNKHIDKACKSKGLAGCISCPLNVENILPQPAYISSPKAKNLDLLTAGKLSNILQAKGLDYETNNRIISLASEFLSQSEKLGDAPLSLHIQAIDSCFLNTATCIISPFGWIKHCNFAFRELGGLWLNECFYEILGHDDIQSILHLAKDNIARKSGSITLNKGFLRCLFTLEVVGCWMILQMMPCN